MDTTNLIENLQRALRFDVSFYREVANNERYNPQALTIVVLAAALSGIGALLGSLLGRELLSALLGLILGVIVTLIGYYVWAYVVWAYVVQFVGAQFFQGQATGQQLLRTLGYAYAPTALNVLSFIPYVGGLFTLPGQRLGACLWLLRRTGDPSARRQEDTADRHYWVDRHSNCHGNPGCTGCNFRRRCRWHWRIVTKLTIRGIIPCMSSCWPLPDATRR